MAMTKRGGGRTGYTTGSSATAAAKAALMAIMSQRAITTVDITLPGKGGGLITIPVRECVFGRDRARCVVVKDGGDDPDVTHGTDIVVDLFVTGESGAITIDGGEGVGMVTKPGLGLEIGRPAINPVPKKMITGNLLQAGDGFFAENGARVVVSVPRGRELGPKTDNPRLGIVGGISILGTSGIVIPFSTASYAASIRQNLDVAMAMNESTIILTTGGRSEDFARSEIAGLPEHCFVQMGDFVGYSVRECAKRAGQIKKVYVVGFIGKLAKMAAGVKQTHVKGSKVDMKFLAGLAEEAGAPDAVIRSIMKANTARHVSEIITANKVDPFFGLVCREVLMQMTKHVQDRIALEVVLFDFEGGILARRRSNDDDNYGDDDDNNNNNNGDTDSC